MHPRHLLIFAALLLLASALSCAGPASTPSPEAPADQNVGASKNTSASFTYFFQDTVGNGSGPNWSISNSSGNKAWTLSNTSYSSPKAWVIGQNYWNGENDRLTSIGFSVPNNTVGIKLSFYSRWNILANDFGRVDYSTNNGSSWTQVQAFSNGSNAAYPNWTKYTYALPDNISGSAQTWKLRFRFTSDASSTSWGFGVDSISVYQTKLNAPLNLTATKGTVSGQVDLDWDHNNAGSLSPDQYLIYRAPDNGGAPGTFTLLNNVAYPASAYSDNNGTGTIYWYKVKARKTGYPDSAFGNQDSGYGIGTWMSLTVDSDDDPWHTSIALINGKPAIAYYERTNGNLRYAYSSTVDGSSGWTDVLVDNGGSADVGFTPSLAQINGKPAIAHFDNSTFDLKYSYSSAADGSAGTWSSIVLDSTGSVGPFSSLKVVNSKPAIAYQDAVGDVKYAYSSTVGGTLVGDWTIIYVEGNGSGGNPIDGLYNSLAIVNGFPAVSHASNSPGALVYSYSSQVDGSSGWSTITVDNTVGEGDYTSLALFGGKPSIAYQSQGLLKLYYAYSSTAGGTLAGDWSKLEVSGAVGAGYYAGLLSAYGKPAITHMHNGSGDLLYSSSSAADGSSGWSTITVDSTGVVGEYATSTLINGKPAVAYRDQTNTALKYAWLN
jgi:hypothetical protein